MSEEDFLEESRWEQVVRAAKSGCTEAVPSRAPEGFARNVVSLRPIPETAWQAVTAAARACSGGFHPPGPLEEAAPYGFATRTVARWRGVRRSGEYRLWERWSLGAGAASLGLCAVLTLLPSSSDEMLIPVPEFELTLSS